MVRPLPPGPVMARPLPPGKEDREKEAELVEPPEPTPEVSKEEMATAMADLRELQTFRIHNIEDRMEVVSRQLRELRDEQAELSDELAYLKAELDRTGEG